ncbi:MAG TPA: aldehyde dehydrogenase family protein, partial [Candidatus Acidoferrum sp.]|nr:aldehyde dehydrogenase family protein [Candidatus Acidoferrum sp.]
MTTTSTSHGLLHDLDWSGKIYADGWRQGSGQMTVTNKSTGASLGTVGTASAADVRSAAASAAAHQPAWAAMSRQDRAAILKRARALLTEHADEFVWWLVREAGSTVPKSQFEVHVLTTGYFDKIISDLETAAFEETIVDKDG